MKPLNFTTKSNQLLTIIPDTMAHADGHPVLTYTYNIYQGHSSGSRLEAKKSHLHLEKHRDQSFLGVITFDMPGTMFTYTPHGDFALEDEDIEEIIKFITEIRDNPEYWRLS